MPPQRGRGRPRRRVSLAGAAPGACGSANGFRRCLALDLDYNAELAELRRPAHLVSHVPDDLNHLTDDQWRALVELAKQFRIANEGRQRPAGSTETPPAEV